MKKLILLLLVTVFSFSHYSNAKWAYMSEYPWVWDAETENWFYLPAVPLAWSPNTQQWQANPYAENSYNVESILGESHRAIVLYVNGEAFGYFHYNLNDDPNLNGTMKFEAQGKTYDAFYGVTVNNAKGIGVFDIHLWDGETPYDTVTLVLDFAEENGGSFSLIGNLGYSSCLRCTFHGEFRIYLIVSTFE